ncbi:MAG: hypothetical protein HZA88_16755 [Verrucomicrobia bacterium]|nr:hypothetical protein [Verrucomicrobiota bacterium]
MKRNVFLLPTASLRLIPLVTKLFIAGIVAWFAMPARCDSSAPALQTQAILVLPTPKQVQLRAGRVLLTRRESTGQRGCCIVAGPEAGFAAEVLAQRLGAPITTTRPSGNPVVTLRLDSVASFAAKLDRDARAEAYRLEVNKAGVEIIAVEPEGLLRAAATLLQILQVEKDAVFVPELTITDWPAVRYRCASDWLINAEINRWSYDWGDGRQACLARIKRKLDLCFAYKINQVWFDGFGWDTQRSEGYADFVRECTGYARQRGIKLTFAGYGGGYGTSYQKSELYRYGYFGKTLVNRRPYPDGAEYLCRGMKQIEQSRRYGTCLSNEALQQAKLEEMKRFVAAVEPGFLYIHDIDTGTYAASQSSWLMRCDECRKRWPSDELTDPRGQAGAMADWYRQIRRTLDSITTPRGYRAARDLTLIFTSPLYTEYYEKGPLDLWQRETDYFCLMSRLLGPAAGVEFGLREQFYRPDGGRKIAHLRAALDQVGAGHGIYVIAFGGGDHYLSDDLANISGAMAHFYDGAEAVCLSNGGVHEEPVQVLNAEQLWAGSLAGYHENPPDEASAQNLFRRMAAGKYRPAALFGPGRFFDQICRRLWGETAGRAMFDAYMTAGETGEGPVSRVWWTVTKEVARLQATSTPKGFRWEDEHARWLRRLATTEQALAHARRAAAMSDDEDIRWFARCLLVGTHFSKCMALSVQLRVREEAATRAQLAKALTELESQVAAGGGLVKTDPLGGDPGCWMETIANLRKLNGL